MDIIKNNPYRIIGILVGTSTREEQSNSRRLKMYIEAEQEIPEDYSFPNIGSLDRNIKVVNDAISKLNLNNDRVNASLFWFYNGNIITDEPVFDALKASKEESKEALEVWIKLATTDEVTKRNASAFQNLSTIYLNSAFKKTTISKINLEKGITLKLKFLESDFINDFIKLSSDTTYKVSKEALQIEFLTQVYNQIEKADKNLVDWYLECITKNSFTAKQNYLNNFVLKPIEVVKNLIEENKITRKESPSKAYVLGSSLYTTGSEKINTIKNILGKNNIQFTSITDKLSDEILQCGIVYFKKYKDTATDPGEKAMDLFKKAKNLAVGSIAIQRCQENTENLQEWINEKPERDKLSQIKSYFDTLIRLFAEFDNKNETIANAKILVNTAKPILINIKDVLGSKDELYLRLSTRVAGQAQGYIIEEVNNVQENFNYNLGIDRYGTLNRIKSALKNGWEVTNLIGTLDMEDEYKTVRFIPNKNTMRSLCTQLDVSTTTISRPPIPTSLPPAPSRPTPPNSNSKDINWGGWIFGVIIFIIAIKSCSAANKNDYDNNTTYPTVDSLAVVVDSSATVTDTPSNGSIQNVEIIDNTAASYNETQSNLKLEDLDGSWNGTGEQLDDNSSWSIKLFIDSFNGVYKIEYPDIECKGNLMLVNNEPGKIVFKEKIYAGVDICVNNLRAELFIINSNKIEIKYYYDGSDELNATGYLTR